MTLILDQEVTATSNSKAGVHFSTKSAAPDLIFVNGSSGNVDGTHREVGDTTTWTTNSPTMTMAVYGTSAITTTFLPPPPAYVKI